MENMDTYLRLWGLGRVSVILKIQIVSPKSKKWSLTQKCVPSAPWRGTTGAALDDVRQRFPLPAHGRH